MATGESVIKVYTTNNYYGIKCDVVIPANPAVGGSTDYFDLYLGLGDKVEGGLSYSTAGWKKFLNTGYQASGKNSNYWRSAVMTNQPNAGDRVSIELINNLNGTATIKVNGTTYCTLPVYGGLSSATTVKQVHGCEDYTGLVKHSQASFSYLKIRKSDGSYINWDGTVPTGNLIKINATDYYVYSVVPMSTKLNQG
jgi:hypothetical protein